VLFVTDLQREKCQIMCHRLGILELEVVESFEECPAWV
jgi:hypothetical protein